MGTKKLNFSEMKNALSRSEMKKIMAGSGATSCTTNSDCSGIHKTCSNGTVVTATCNKILGYCETVCVF